MISSRQNSLHGFEILFELPVFDSVFQIQKRSGKGEGGEGEERRGEREEGRRRKVEGRREGGGVVVKSLQRIYM